MKTPAVPVFAARPAGLLGVDVSAYQQPALLSYDAMALDGVVWSYARACEGIDPDLSYADHARGFRGAGILTGGYCFARARHSAEKEADGFLRSLASMPGDLPPVLDLERGGAADNLPPAALLEWVHTFFDRLRAALGREPWLYGGPGFLDAALPRDHDLGSVGLWVADYNPSLLLPTGWPSALAWQFTERGHVAGIPSPSDCSVWLGSLDDLRASVLPPLGPPAAAACDGP